MTNTTSHPTSVKVLLKPDSMDFIAFMQETYPSLTLSRLINDALGNYEQALQDIGEETRGDES